MGSRSSRLQEELKSRDWRARRQQTRREKKTCGNEKKRG
jgi:hypothetical protein